MSIMPFVAKVLLNLAKRLHLTKCDEITVDYIGKVKYEKDIRDSIERDRRNAGNSGMQSSGS